MQTISIAGNIGKDAETRHTGQGDKVTSFSVAVSNGKDRDATWYDCSIWGDRGEKVAQYLTKGQSVALNGKPGARVYNDKAYLQIRVNDFSFIGKRQESQAPSRDYDAPAKQEPAKPFEIDDEIPF